MDAILNYLDSLFAGFPDSPEKTRLKAEKLAELQKRYEELIREGKNGNEASGIVISGAGLAEEVKSRLGGTVSATGSSSGGTEPRTMESGQPIIIEQRYRRRDRRYEERKGNSLLYSMFWLIVVILYLAVSYYTHNWVITLLIFTAGGVIFYFLQNSAKGPK